LQRQPVDPQLHGICLVYSPAAVLGALALALAVSSGNGRQPISSIATAGGLGLSSGAAGSIAPGLRSPAACGSGRKTDAVGFRKGLRGYKRGRGASQGAGAACEHTSIACTGCLRRATHARTHARSERQAAATSAVRRRCARSLSAVSPHAASPARTGAAVSHGHGTALPRSKPPAPVRCKLCTTAASSKEAIWPVGFVPKRRVQEKRKHF